MNRTDNAPWIVTGKIFECIRSNAPILALGPIESDANDVLVNVGHQPFVNYEDKETIKERVLVAYRNRSQSANKVNSDTVAQYSRKNLTMELAKICDEVVK